MLLLASDPSSHDGRGDRIPQFWRIVVNSLASLAADQLIGPKILRTYRQVLMFAYVLIFFCGETPCRQTGRRRALVRIVKGSTERAKMQKTCSSPSSKPRVQTKQSLPGMMACQLSTNLGGGHASSRSRR